MTQDYLMEISLSDTVFGIQTPVCWRDGWTTNVWCKRGQWVHLSTAIVLENIYTRDHRTCLTMSRRRGMFDISSVPLTHVLLWYGNMEECIPASQRHARTSCCATVFLIFRKVDDQVKVIPTLTGQCVTATKRAYTRATQCTNVVDNQGHSIGACVYAYREPEG